MPMMPMVLIDSSERAAGASFRVARGTAKRVVDFEVHGPGADVSVPGMDIGIFTALTVIAGGKGGGQMLAWRTVSLSVDVVMLTAWLVRGGNDAYHEDVAWYYDGGPPGEGTVWRLRSGTKASTKTEAIDKANRRGVELVKAANVVDKA